MGWGRPWDKLGLRGQSRGAKGAGAESQGPPAAEGSVTPWAGLEVVGRGGKAAAGWESGLVSCLEGKGPAEGSGGSSRQAHPCLSPALSSLLLEKRGNCEPRVGRAG